MTDGNGRIAAIWRFPVKSMQGETLEEAELTASGFLGDRAYALIDVASGKVVSAKSAKQFPDLLACSATFVAPPVAGEVQPPVTITLGDGSSVRSDDPDSDAVLSRYFGRKVVLSATAPTDFTIDQYHPDVEGADPAGHRDTVVEQRLGSAFFDDMGVPSPVPPGAFFDLFPVSVLTTSTLRTASNLAPGSNFDVRRFRMNLIVDTAESGFVENSWVGRAACIEGGAELSITMPDPRCVMTTLAQSDDIAVDRDVLRTLVKNNRLEVQEGVRFPCCGVYAVATTGGIVKEGAAFQVT